MTIIARVPTKATLPAVSREIKNAVANNTAIHVEAAKVLGADCWIGCRFARPHIDPDWMGKLFLTLALAGDHEFGDAKTVTTSHVERWLVRRGSLFVVDPMVPHWIFPRNFEDGQSGLFIALQWEVPRSKARIIARDLVRQIGAEWVECHDSRYASWRLTSSSGPSGAPAL